MLRRVTPSRAAVALAAALAVILTGCSTSMFVDVGRSAGSATSSSAATVSPPSVAPSAVPTAVPTATPAVSTEPVSPALALLRTLRAVAGSTWQTMTDERTGTSFALPRAVAATQRTEYGIARRIYTYSLSKQSGISVGYIRTPSPAAAASAALAVYPEQLASSFRSVGADDAAISERTSTTVAGLPAVSFRFTFTPTSVPQIPPVWLTTAVASDANVVLLQTIVFPVNGEFDYTAPVRRAQQQLVASFRRG